MRRTTDAVIKMQQQMSSFERKSNSSQGNKRADESYNRNEEEKIRRRREWEIQQEMERRHEERKQKMILEFELKLARERRKKLNDRTRSHSSNPSRSRSNSRSPPRRSRSATPVRKLESSNENQIAFKGPSGVKVSWKELRQIKVDIRRNIPVTMASLNQELHRSILNLDDIKVKRRDGEGARPIFDREELKGSLNKMEGENERRTVITSATESRRSRSRSRSSKTYRKEKSNCSQSRSARRESSERHTRRRSRSSSTERRRSHSQPYSSTPYIQQVPVPVYYGGFPPRPMMIGPGMPPMFPMRGQMMMERNRLPTVPGPTLSQRFPSQNAYRFKSHSNTKYGPM